MASRSRSPSRDRYRSRTRSLTPLSDRSRSPVRRRSYDSRTPSRSRSPTPRRNGRHRTESRSRSRGRTASPTVRSTKVVVERLTKNINEDHLEEIFGQYGRIKDLDLPINRTHGTNRGTAYILYETEGDAEEAIAHMHEAQLDGAVINVSIVLPRRKISPAPPLARRGGGFDPRGPPLEVVVAEAQADPTVVEEDPDPSAKTGPDEVHHLHQPGSAPDRTPTGLVQCRVPQRDPLVLLLRPEVVVADTGAAPDPTPDLLRRPRDVEVVAEATTAIAGEGARAETVTKATIAVGPGLRAEPVTAVAVEAAADTDERDIERDLA
ncbi:RNA-binding protein with serine-rich domain 1-A [Colletotrichum liriopes]|uniref:RNA-binding protein with serine-rich domain 1-A n=1 Tax=Colletotrichum liriopes TaxID=708192 RepID=A0AA37LUJ9_9PEZI|nr:RNA-binding protein with serine-rich domain 1-A [Colletotrichum liriopes]